MAFDDFDTQIQSDEMIPEGWEDDWEHVAEARDLPPVVLQNSLTLIGVCVYSAVSDLLKEITDLSQDDRYELARAAEKAVKDTRAEQLDIDGE